MRFLHLRVHFGGVVDVAGARVVRAVRVRVRVNVKVRVRVRFRVRVRLRVRVRCG